MKQKIAMIFVLIFYPNFTSSQWVQPTSPESHNLWSVFFTDSINGHAVGGSGFIIRTSDGGQNWTKVDAPDNLINDVHFIDSGNDWAVGAGGGLILKTTDASKNWIDESVSGVNNFNSVFFVDVTTGWIVMP